MHLYKHQAFGRTEESNIAATWDTLHRATRACGMWVEWCNKGTHWMSCSWDRVQNRHRMIYAFGSAYRTTIFPLFYLISFYSLITMVIQCSETISNGQTSIPICQMISSFTRTLSVPACTVCMHPCSHRHLHSQSPQISSADYIYYKYSSTLVCMFQLVRKLFRKLFCTHPHIFPLALRIASGHILTVSDSFKTSASI